jgi:hypothetical protein
MQLNITEFDDSLYDDNSFKEEDYNQIHSEIEYEKIPENNVQIKVIKKGVHFANSTLKPMNQAIPKSNAKINRPHIPQPKPKISYDDILSKMGMLVSDGKLHLIDRNILTPQQQKEILFSQRQSQNQYQSQPQNQYQSQPQNQYQSQSMDDSNIPKNSYIYNKYFKDEIQQNPSVRRPKSLHEYKMMVIDDYLQRQRIKQMKSKKLVMPTSNINISAGNSANLNKLFSFSKR